MSATRTEKAMLSALRKIAGEARKSRPDLDKIYQIAVNAILPAEQIIEATVRNDHA